MVSKSCWIFGYGSLMWRPDFPFVQSRIGYIKGWRRVFWQGSADHRGTPDAPGRVVTIVADERETCIGMAYHIAPERYGETIEILDYREKGGYRLEFLPVVFENNEQVFASVYIATPDNPEFLGQTEPEKIARQISTSSGPSGPNDEYVIKLARALRKIGANDPHVFEVERWVRSLKI
ncbi:MAG: gamma-glutamylcyclotransferase [Pseudomonadota bacterium]|nr:gamma-glutamylcyclotransferase [Pseudomonadota bacterium]